MKRFPLLLLAPATLLTGCEKSSAELVPAPSSNAALARALDAIDRRDRDAMLTLVSGGPAAQESFSAIIETLKAIEAFKQKFISTYGEDAWTAFQAPLPPEDKRPDQNVKLPDIGQIKTNASAWEADDTNHGVFNKLPGFPLTFIRQNGGWVIDGTKVFPNEKTRAGFIALQNRMGDFHRKYTKAIGHPGISAEDIDYQMGKEFMQVITGTELKLNGQSSWPDRFKVDQL